MDAQYEEWLTKYLEGTLPEEEKRQLEDRLATDPELAEELALLRTIRNAVSYKNNFAEKDAGLLKTLRKEGAPHFSKSPKLSLVWKRFYPWIARAAVFVLLASTFYYFLEPGYGDPFKKYKDYPEAGFISKSTDPALELELKNAQDAINKQDYELAVQIFRAHPKVVNDDPELKLFWGICLFETGNIEEAESVFSGLLSGFPAFKDEAAWYLALTFAAQEKWQEALLALEALPPFSRHAAQAEGLSAAIRKRQH